MEKIIDLGKVMRFRHILIDKALKLSIDPEKILGITDVAFLRNAMKDAGITAEKET